MSKLAPENEVVAGRYRISARIAAGGMGEVYRAWDPNLRRTVALKILPLDHIGRPEAVDRFRAEAQSAARLSHPNVVQVHDWGETESTCFMVMEYVRGRNLREVLAHWGPLAPRQTLELMIQVLEALEAAHARGLVHRDIKPENILITVDGKVKVADFGIARAMEDTRATGGLFGTVAYVAPEQARGTTVDGRTDIYSAGCVMYELLTGVRPFEGDAAAVLTQHLNARVPRPSDDCPEAGPEIDAVVAKATHPDPALRYQSAGEMRQELERIRPSLPEGPVLAELSRELTSEVSPEMQDTAVPEPGKRRRWRWWPILLLLAVAAAAGAGWMFRPVEVPKVVGIDRAAAQERLSAAGLTWREKQIESSEAVGIVLASDPPPGASVRRGGEVVLEVSKGQPLATLPNLVDLEIEEAKRIIIDAGLLFTEPTARFDAAPAGRVIEQDPKPGKVRRGDPVNLVISKGPEKTKVPETRGKTYEEAVSILESSGLQAVKEEVFSDAPAGTVADQSPGPGEEVVKGSSVKLIVSKGSEPFAMPDVRGRACAQSKTDLESLGLVVVVNSRGGAGCAVNKVLDQDPFPGAQVRKGSEATLYVS